MREVTAPIRPKDRFLVFGAPDIRAEEIAEVTACLESGWIGTGPRVATFERDFASYIGVRNAVAVNSCTAALHLSLMTLDLKPTDEVITTPLTFCATVNAIIHAGGTPVVADVDPHTMNIDPAAIAAKISPRTRAILPVHLTGRPCDMVSITSIARDHGLKIIEDCAHAIETTYHGQRAGTFGELGCYSFYVTKNLVTGEGGMITTNDDELAQRIKILALHGMDKDAWKRFSDSGYRHYQVVETGFKYNMMDIQAAMGIHQLRRLEENYARRKNIWEAYDASLSDLPIVLPAAPEPDTRHAYHLYTILIDSSRAGINRDQFLGWMSQNNIGIGVHYVSLTSQPVYQKMFGWHDEDAPYASRIGSQTVSLPLSPKMTDEDTADVIATVRAAFT